MKQIICTPGSDYAGLDEWIRRNGCRKVLLVCDGSIGFLEGLNRKLARLSIPVIRFSDFQPNPRYESVVSGVACFRSEGCDSIMAVGGGSAMDVAKCIRLYARQPGDGRDGSWLKARPVPEHIPFLVLPTTAGTGSEATRYAVIYHNGSKQSVTDERCIPETVLMDPGALSSLPAYQRKATMMDALCHAVESFWSVNSTDESMRFSTEAIRGVLEHMQGYLANTETGNAGMLRAAYIAGKAINITQTTAGHAMCYQITGLFGCAHGHAAILCDRVLFPFMIGHTDRCVDPRGAAYLQAALDGIGMAMGCRDARDGAEKLNRIFDSLQLEIPSASPEQFAVLESSVNPERLKNHPIALDPDTIGALYRRILNKKA